MNFTSGTAIVIGDSTRNDEGVWIVRSGAQIDLKQVSLWHRVDVAVIKNR